MPLRLAALVAAALTLSACASSGGANGWAAPPDGATAERAPERGTRGERVARRPERPVAAAPPHRRERLEFNPPERTRPAPAAETASGLLLPVAGFDPADLRDTFHAPRSGGRTHRAIDLAAPTGTPLLAVEDGVITRKHWNRLGGHTLYLRSADGDTDYYYAHLHTYAPGIEIGTRVRRGDVIGTVGATGNARGPHLHFQVLDRRGEGRGTPINPYDLLRTADVAAADAGAE